LGAFKGMGDTSLARPPELCTLHRTRASVVVVAVAPLAVVLPPSAVPPAVVSEPASLAGAGSWHPAPAPSRVPGPAARRRELRFQRRRALGVVPDGREWNPDLEAEFLRRRELREEGHHGQHHRSDSELHATSTARRALRFKWPAP